MLARDSLASTMGVFLTGAAVTSGPWLLTTAVLVAMQVSAPGSDAAGVFAAQRIVTLAYAGAIILGAPIDIVLSRYASDRVYEHRSDQIAAPLRRVLAMSLLLFAAVGAVTMGLAGAPAALAIPGTALCAVVAAQWLLLSAAGGLSSPGIILRAFAVGAPASLAAALALSRPDVMGAPGYLYGFGAGQLVTLALLLGGTLRALPPEEDESARILPAFREYWLLAAAAFTVYAGLWVDKILLLAIAGGAAAAAYSTLASVAWLSVVPACAALFIAVETVFYRRFRAFYDALETGGSLPEIEALARDLRVEVGRTLRSVAGVQASVTLLCLLIAPIAVERLGLGGGGTPMLRALLVGAGFQVLALSVTLLMHYFDFRREAFAMAALQFVAGAGITLAVGVERAGFGYAAACALTCVVGLPLLRRRMETLLAHTFQSQPYDTAE